MQQPVFPIDHQTAPYVLSNKQGPSTHLSNENRPAAAKYFFSTLFTTPPIDAPATASLPENYTSLEPQLAAKRMREVFHNETVVDDDSHLYPQASTYDDEPPIKKSARTPANNGLSKPNATKKKYETTRKKFVKKPIIPGKEYKIYVEGLPWAASVVDVADFFKAAGKPLSVELPLEEDGRSSGTAFLKYSRRSELEAAMAMNGSSWPNSVRWLKIQVSIWRLSSQHAYRL
jgi:hypothetical protein